MKKVDPVPPRDIKSEIIADSALKIAALEKQLDEIKANEDLVVISQKLMDVFKLVPSKDIRSQTQGHAGRLPATDPYFTAFKQTLVDKLKANRHHPYNMTRSLLIEMAGNTTVRGRKAMGIHIPEFQVKVIESLEAALATLKHGPAPTV